MAMLASSFGTVLIDFWTRENNDFRQPKVIWAILTFFICAFNCIFYSSYTSSLMPDNATKYFDLWQILFLLVGLFLAIYSYCLLLMDPQIDKFVVLSDKYEYKENKKAVKSQIISILIGSIGTLVLGFIGWLFTQFMTKGGI